MLLIAAVLLSLCPLPAGAQQAEPRTSEQKPPTPSQQGQFEETVEVVGVTPIHGVGLPRHKVPANVQVFTAADIDAALDVPSLLTDRAASVQASEAQGGTFQPDLLFRGFSGSPLLGASEGLAVYQDGVRVNEAFGDTINWDALPTGAIASINLMPGSNPLFGLNALGGALSIRTKDGFGFPGRRASVSTGSFGRHQVEAELGGHGSSFAYFVAGSLLDEGGWRDHSPSTVRRLFGDLGWRGTSSSLNVGVTAVSNDLTGNGPAPIQLLDADRSAVFTYPDRTDNDLAFLTVKGQHRPSARTLVEVVAYYRHSRIGTFNGDAADDADDDEEVDGGEEEDEEEDESFSGINNRSTTRGHAFGVTGQVTRTRSLWGRENHLIAGMGADASTSAFDSSAEWAELTPDRGTVGVGIYDPDAFVDLRSRTLTWSAFATNIWSVTPKLALTGSARLNWTAVTLRDRIGTALTGDHRFGRLNPAAGVTYQVRPGLSLYGSYAQSSRVPTPVELTCADPEDPCRLPNAFVSDPPLDAIVAGTWEGGARGTVVRADWSLTAFTSTANDDIIFVSSGTLRGEGHFENVERTRRSGVEASLEYDVPGRLTAFAAYTIQRALFGADLRIASRFHPLAENAEIFVPSGNRLPGVPTHTARFGVSAAVTSGLNLGVMVRAQSGQYLRGDEANLLSTLPAFAVINAHARYRITSRISAVLEVRNLLDAHYSTFGVLGDAELLGEAFEDEPRFYSPGAPRAAWIGVGVRF